MRHRPRQLAVRNPKWLLSQLFPSSSHRHARSLRTIAVDCVTNFPQESRLSPRTARANPPRADLETWVINGQSWPHTEQLTYKTGESIRWRWINASDETHPMHMHGHHFRVDAMGDNETDHQRREEERSWVVTQPIDSGYTMMMTWNAERPGNWLFHCHIQFHIAPEVS